ncbi:MAG TPA: hypothetical protein VE862_04100, partial [Candidatus Acidoferrum sp.]|nr:hypothetical protein [Candidatus Acidoferrum sp.]
MNIIRTRAPVSCAILIAPGTLFQAQLIAENTFESTYDFLTRKIRPVKLAEEVAKPTMQVGSKNSNTVGQRRRKEYPQWEQG